MPFCSCPVFNNQYDGPHEHDAPLPASIGFVPCCLPDAHLTAGWDFISSRLKPMPRKKQLHPALLIDTQISDKLFIHRVALVSFWQEMEELREGTKIRKSNKCCRNWDKRVSFSARLPNDVRGAFADSICAVKYSTNPFSDIRDSILEMIHSAGVQDWKEMEELIYCYIVLNSSDVHNIIKDAFLSLLFSSQRLK